SKRSAHTHFLPQPVAKRETAVHPLFIANKKVSELQQKVVSLQTELDTCKTTLKAHEGNKTALQDARAEASSLKRVMQLLRVENERLKAQTINPSITANPMHQSSQNQQQRIKELEEQLERVHWEKNDMTTKFHSENQARAKLITKLNKVNEANHSLAQQLQQSKQNNSHSMDSPDSQKMHEENKNMHHRIDQLCHENNHLKKEAKGVGGGGHSHDSVQLGQALNEAKKHCSMLNEEKNRLATELQSAKEKGDKINAQLEKSEWMNKMMKDQLDFCKKNSEMWQEQSKNLSEHLKRTTGGMIMLQPQSFYPPPSLLSPSPQAIRAPTRAVIPQTPPSYLRHSATPSQISDVITLDEESDLSKVKQEDLY
ncbi:hypothetical protein PENTCL1PPCAC_7317, partial [Pristionchus entomophagus]